MTLETKTFTTLVSPDDESGLLSAMFSTFHVVDKDGDVVLPSAFQTGQEVPMVWSHDWHKPIGKGAIEVTPEGAVFKGKFNLNTSWGRDAYESVKFTGPLQEYSWGFRVTDHEYEDRGDAKVRVIKGARVFEVSPVLVGAGEGTRTLAVKDATVNVNIGVDGFTTATDAAINAIPDPLPESVAGQAEDLETRAAALLVSTKDLQERRAKEGRVLSERNRTALAKARDAMQAAVGEVDALLAASEPQPAKAASEEQRRNDARRALAEYQLLAARVLADVAG
jgi:HK97 family phage prohead protease